MDFERHSEGGKGSEVFLNAQLDQLAPQTGALPLVI